MIKKRRTYRRRKYIVNRSFQYRFIGVMLLMLIVMSLAALGGVYYSLWSTLQLFELAHDPVTVALFSMVGQMVTLEVLVIAPFVIVIGILLTHKVAGPLVRIKAALEQMANGKFDVNITLRKGDSLTDLAELINRLASSLRQRAR